MNKSPIIIVGMHRSGTTLLAKILEELGVFIGNKYGKNKEALFFKEINEWILFQANITWDNIYNLQFIDDIFWNEVYKVVLKKINSSYFLKYFGLIKYFYYNFNNKGSFLWGWKDPRNSLLLNVWKIIFPQAKIIHIYRNPIDVANSLKEREDYRRNNLNNHKYYTKEKYRLSKIPVLCNSMRLRFIEEGIKLWKDYMNKILTFKNEYSDDFFEFPYEYFLSNPIEILSNIELFLDTDFKNKKEKVVCKLNSERKYAFIRNEELLEKYKKYKDDEMFRYFNYDKII